MKELDEIRAVERAAAMTKVAADISTQFGVSMEQVTESMRKIGEQMGSVQSSFNKVSVSRGELAVLQRVAYMASLLLPAMREAGIGETHFAEFTALRQALLDVESIQAVTDDEVMRDLMDLAADLEPPK